MTDYPELTAQLAALTVGVPHPVANLANAAALLWQELEDINWAGFYLLEGDVLVLGPFQGKPACIEIPLGRGVCGTAAARDCTLVVPDVHAFPGHIACDAASAAEIVIPLRRDGRVIGVLDIDSPLRGRFTEKDREWLELFAFTVEEALGYRAEIEAIIKRLRMTRTGSGYSELICPKDAILEFIDEMDRLEISITGFSWWCHVMEGHEPCGLGGPYDDYGDGWYSELVMDTFTSFDSNEAYRTYFTTEYLNCDPCLVPAFSLSPLE